MHFDARMPGRSAPDSHSSSQGYVTVLVRRRACRHKASFRCTSLPGYVVDGDACDVVDDATGFVDVEHMLK